MSRHFHRPELHITPETGILDAPAGALYTGSTWHLFHQFRPQPDASPRWAHVFAGESPLDWEICDDVIASRGAEIGVRAGAVTVDPHGAHLYFTSVTGAGTNVQVATIENLEDTTDELSDDASQLDVHVRRQGAVLTNTAGYTDFRSPCVVPDWKTSNRDEGHSGWIMFAVEGSIESPRVIVLRSPDGFAWTPLGPLTFDGDTGVIPTTAKVSPRIFRLRDEIDGDIYDILLINQEIDGIDVSGYLVGYLEETVFTVVTPFTRIDMGHDFTRPRIVTMAPGVTDLEHRYDEAVAFGLMNGVGRLDDATAHESYRDEGWANCLSLPRVLTLQGGLIFQTPVPGLVDHVADSAAAGVWSGLLEIPAGSAATVTLIAGDGTDAAVIRHEGTSLTIDRSMNPHHQGDPIARAELIESDSDSLTIVVDGSTLEVFADGGSLAMSSRVYFTEGCTDYRFELTGDASVLRSHARFGEHLYTRNAEEDADLELDYPDSEDDDPDLAAEHPKA